MPAPSSLLLFLSLPLPSSFSLSLSLSGWDTVSQNNPPFVITPGNLVEQ